MTEKPSIYYSEPYQVKGKQGWKVDKFAFGKKQQTINLWTKKLADEFLCTINIYVDNKLMYTGH